VLFLVPYAPSLEQMRYPVNWGIHTARPSGYSVFGNVPVLRLLATWKKIIQALPFLLTFLALKSKSSNQMKS
jgi:hypothetical protein